MDRLREPDDPRSAAAPAATTHERWRQVTELFHNALPHDAVSRARYLDEVCAADAALRADVDAMLAAHAGAGQFGERPIAPLPAPLPLLACGSLVGSYRIERLIGAGGMGAVFLAWDTTLNRPVALKVMSDVVDPELSRARLLREARNAAVLNHPNICTIHEVREAAGRTFIAMEFVNGQSLRDRLNDQALALDEVLRYGIQAADALAHAHEHGVIHRDFKAANVIINGAGLLKIVDFGLARRTDAFLARPSDAQSVVPPGAAAGTPYSMAPEQIRGESAGAATDVWALGVLLYEMVAGTPPFTAGTTVELFASVLRDTPAALPRTTPVELEALVGRCLDKDASERGTARELCEQLRSIAPPPAVAAAAVVAPGGGPRAALPREARRLILLMPFRNVGADPNTEYFADGLTEELITDLSHFGSLRVISRTTALRLRSRARDIRTIARELGADLVLDGSVRRSGASLRITVQLIDCATDAPVWADKFTGTDGDLFELQARLSRRIIDALQITPTYAEAKHLAQRPIPDLRAYDLYSRARHKLLRFSAEDIDEAVRLLREGLDLLGDNELLLATLGHAFLYYVHWGVRPDPRYLDEAERCASVVIRLSPDSAYGRALVGVLSLKRAKLQEAVRHLGRAVAADPANTEAMLWLVYCLLTAGQPRTARPLLERLLMLDPLTAINHAAYGWLHIAEARTEDALPHYQRAYELDRGAPLVSFLWGWSLAQAGLTVEAARHLTTFSRTAGQSVFGGLAAGLAAALSGDRTATRTAMGLHVTAAAHHDEGLAHFVSQVYAVSGDFDEAYWWLEQALRRGFLDYPCLASGDPLYGAFRQDARFVRLLPEIQRRWQAFEV